MLNAGKEFTCMKTEKGRNKFLHESWAVAKKLEELERAGNDEEARKLFTVVGPLTAGSWTIHNTGHIHRGPGNLTGSIPRRSIFVALCSKYNICESEVIYSWNYEERWRARFGEARKELVRKRSCIENELMRGSDVVSCRRKWKEARKEYERHVDEIAEPTTK